jgi:hypothetical protein
MPPQAVQVPFFFLVGLYVVWQFMRRNSRNGGMAEWRNGGMAEWRTEWRNGRKNGRMVKWREWLHTYSCSLSENKSFAFLTWATRRTKKLDGESCYVARWNLIFPFLASSDFRRRSRKSDRNGYIRTIYGTHTPTPTTTTHFNLL